MLSDGFSDQTECRRWRGRQRTRSQRPKQIFRRCAGDETFPTVAFQKFLVASIHFLGSHRLGLNLMRQNRPTLHTAHHTKLRQLQFVTPSADISSSSRHKPASTRLLRYAIRRLGAWMTDSRPAGISALPLVVAPLGASVQTGLVIGRRRDGGRGVSVAFLGGSLGLRQAHGSFRSKSKTRQRYQQNAQHKAHDGISILRSYSFQRTTLTWDAHRRFAARPHFSQFELADQIRSRKPFTPFASAQWSQQ